MKSIRESIIDAIESDDKEYALVIVSRVLNNASELESELIELRDILDQYFGLLIEL